MRSVKPSKCFICDEEVSEVEECLSQAYTRYSNVSVPTKISALVGEDFIVVVKQDDVLCQRCSKLVNEMDRLDMELLQIKKTLSSYLLKTYNIHEEEIEDVKSNESEEAEKSGSELVKEELFECSLCGFQTFRRFDFEKHSNLHKSSNVEINFSVVCNSSRNEVNEKPQRSFKCLVCLEKFQRQESYEEHTRECRSEGTREVEEIYLKSSGTEQDVDFSEVIDNSKNAMCEKVDRISEEDGVTRISGQSGEKTRPHKTIIRFRITTPGAYEGEKTDSVEGSGSDLSNPLTIDEAPGETSAKAVSDVRRVPEKSTVVQKENGVSLEQADQSYSEPRREGADTVRIEASGEEVENPGGRSQSCAGDPVQNLTEESEPAQFPDRSNKCSYCKKDFPFHLKLKEHEIRHSAKIAPYQCEYCLEKLEKGGDLTLHVRRAHRDIKTTLVCPLCSRKSPTEYALKRHVLRCHLVKKLQKEIREKYVDGLDLDEKTEEETVFEADDNVSEEEEGTAKEVYVCGLRPSKGKDSEATSEHAEVHDVDGIRHYACDSKSGTKDDSVERTNSAHDEKVDDGRCPHCFLYVGPRLDEHLKESHGEAYGRSECDVLFETHGDDSHLPKDQQLLNDEVMLGELGFLDPEDDSEVVVDTEYTFDEVPVTEAVYVPGEPVESVVKTEHEEQIFCGVCGRKCRTKYGLEKHLKTHSSESGNLGDGYRAAKGSESGQLESGVEEERPWHEGYCSQCDKYFPRRAAYLRHKKTDHSVDKVCPTCGKRFYIMKTYLFHTDYCHREELECKFCHKKFVDPKKLKIHEYMHKRNEGKVFECDSCQKTFKTGSGLRFHRLMHTGKYPYFCEYCGRGFASKHQLEEHVAKHTGEERFVCDVCGKRFQLYDTYHRHRNLHDNPYPKQCDVCHKFFRNASRLSEHRRKIHTGERPYKCPFCPMTFNISSTYKVHLCIHTQKFPHNCKFCNRGFTTRIKYANHLASKHGDFTLLNDKKPNYRQVFPEDN